MTRWKTETERLEREALELPFLSPSAKKKHMTNSYERKGDISALQFLAPANKFLICNIWLCHNVQSLLGLWLSLPLFMNSLSPLYLLMSSIKVKENYLWTAKGKNLCDYSYH